MYEELAPSGWRDGLQTAGVTFFSISDWKAKSAEMRDSMAAMGFSDDEMPSWFSHGVVFGEIPRSANYFVIQSFGKSAAKVFYADHDDFNVEPIAESFDEFLGRIIANPADFLLRMGCYTRCSDGETDSQWIPAEYVADGGG